jgi:hypothetical protein
LGADFAAVLNDPRLLLQLSAEDVLNRTVDDKPVDPDLETRLLTEAFILARLVVYGRWPPETPAIPGPVGETAGHREGIKTPAVVGEETPGPGRRQGKAPMISGPDPDTPTAVVEQHPPGAPGPFCGPLYTLLMLVGELRDREGDASAATRRKLEQLATRIHATGIAGHCKFFAAVIFFQFLYF